jgi:four helix bundle suffix protein
VVANALICLIHQANYLLDRQIAGLERQFVQQGGYRERLAAARSEQRALPTCPRCGRRMVVRNASRAPFLGCSGFPECRGTRQL